MPNPPPFDDEEEVSQDPLVPFLQRIQETALSTFGPSGFDPKRYLDLYLKSHLPSATESFNQILAGSNGSPSVEQLRRFLEDHFEEAGGDVEPYDPPDFQEEPEGFLVSVGREEVRRWGSEVHWLWKSLSRRVAKVVGERPELHTAVALPEGFMVPGSRFRELYYWDSYWVIRGLLVSKMYVTATATVTNLVALATQYGYVINGARTYYTNRSHPPLLSAMIRETYNMTQNLGLVKSSIDVLVREHQFWNSGKHRVVIQGTDGRKHHLSRYYAKWNRPRPESATIDKVSALNVSEKNFYRELASAAESGWDFSTRWMRNPPDFKTMATTSVLPVDLNAFILGMERDIAFFAELVGDKSTAEKFWTASQARLEAMNSILWNELERQWLDYWLDDDKSLQEPYLWNGSLQNKNVFASNYTPLWLEPFYSDPSIVEKVMQSLKDSGLLCPAGIATSLKCSGQQWDFPNGWAPLQHMIVEGLVKSRSKEARALAEDIAARWLKTNYAVFKRTGKMHEKYNVAEPGEFGGGGEYVPQTGFGWSNGVILSFLEEFGWPQDRSIDLY